jgi:hypothetical protein
MVLGSETENREADGVEANPPVSQESLDRISSFRVTYISILMYLLVYLFTVQVFQEFLQLHFEQIVSQAIRVGVSTRPPAQNILLNLREQVDKNPWVTFWRVEVDTAVLAKDGNTWLYVAGRAQIPAYPDRDPKKRLGIHASQLPATATVSVSVNHSTMLSNSILIAYSIVLFTGLFFYHRRVVDLENQVIEEARNSRDASATRASQIEDEIERVRAQLRDAGPAKREDKEEINRLQAEQHRLQAQLHTLAGQERALRGQAGRAAALEEEGRALEDLLEEATGDLGAKSDEIRELERSLRSARKRAGIPGEKAKENELLAKRLRVLYPKLEVDERAIEDIISLRDDTTKLRAEECLKRFSEDADSVGVRRKVGGLPKHLSVYELGFAGKRRIYYTKVANGRFRILVIGAKNTQQSDLDYISRIPKDEIS